jgi:hypothetical protein
MSTKMRRRCGWGLVFMAVLAVFAVMFHRLGWRAVLVLGLAVAIYGFIALLVWLFVSEGPETIPYELLINTANRLAKEDGNGELDFLCPVCQVVSPNAAEAASHQWERHGVKITVWDLYMVTARRYLEAQTSREREAGTAAVKPESKTT